MDNPRIAAAATTRPMLTLIRFSFSPWLTTRLKTSAYMAPSAIRIPTSRVRWLTEQATTP